MPLGSLFGGGSSSGPKPQPLQSETNKKEKREKTSSSAAKDIDKDCKGTTLKINKKSFTIEKKLAEGLFKFNTFKSYANFLRWFCNCIFGL
jgi:hypothetical protein